MCKCEAFVWCYIPFGSETLNALPERPRIFYILYCDRGFVPSITQSLTVQYGNVRWDPPNVHR